MQNVCNTNSRILIQQSEKFIFLGIVLGLHPAPKIRHAVECGPTSILMGHTTPEAVHSSHKSHMRVQQSWIKNVAPDYWLGWVHILHFLFGTNFMLTIL